MPSAAEHAAKTLGATVTDLFAYQFALVPSEVSGPNGFETRPFGDRTLWHCPKLEVAELVDQAGNEIGYCLGVAINAQGVRLRDRVRLPLRSGNEDFWSNVADYVIGLAGRYLILVRSGAKAKIFGDASGMFNCVYDPKTRCVGSSLLLCLDREIEETAAVDYRDTLAKDIRLPFGHTRDRHAKRLAVNHVLDVDEFSEERFWPKPGDIGECKEGEEAAVISAIRDRFGSILAGLVTSLPTAFGVSGGLDSRNMVAAAKPVLGHVNRFYSHTFNFNSRTDFRSAARVMQRLGFSVERYNRQDPPYDDNEIWARNTRFMVSTGFAVGVHQMSNVKLASRPPAGEVVVSGNVMEALRAAHWKSAITARTNVLEFGLKRCLFVGGADFTPEFIEKWLPDFEAWYNGLPPDARNRYIDLVFAEHNLPNLGTMYLAHQNNFYICPFNDRKLLALSASLSVAYRYSNQANRDFLSLTAPELVDVPYAQDFRRKKPSAA